MRRTKALRTFQERYQEAMAVRPPAEALSFSLERLAADTGIRVRVQELRDGHIQAMASQPSGLTEQSEVQPQDTTTLRVRAIEEVLSKTYAKNRWR